MRRWIVMLAAVIALTALPPRGMELGQLIPAAVLMLSLDDRLVVLRTDTGDKGSGETLEDALKDLNDTASGRILLDSVENLILSKESMYLIPQMKELLRPSVRICTAEGELDGAAAWRYLRIHIPKKTLAEAAEESSLQKLMWKEGRLILEDESTEP